jgi:hypothetical protein
MESFQCYRELVQGQVVCTLPGMRIPTAFVLAATVSMSANALTSAAPDPGGPVRASTREVTLPAGTRLTIVLEDSVGSDISRVEQPVHAHLSAAVRMHGETVIPQGSRVSGVVTDATRSAKVKGRAHVAVRFDSLMPRGNDERYSLRAATIHRVAPGTKKDDALKIGLPAAGGAIVGGLLGGEKGAVIGGAAGGGAGTAVVLTTRGKEVHLAKGTRLTIRLSQPLTVRVQG